MLTSVVVARSEGYVLGEGSPATVGDATIASPSPIPAALDAAIPALETPPAP